MSVAIQVEDLAKRYGDTVALAGVSIEVEPGSVLGLLGPNGAGKTTLVRILATLVRPDRGRAIVHGHDVTREPDAVREMIGLTGQFATVDDALTGAENLILIARLLELPRRLARARAAELLDQFDLSSAAGRLVRTYSGGMRRRLDIACSLLGRPAVLFLDEPTTGLDPRARGEVWDLVRGLATEGTTVLLTTQYLDEADRLADRIAVLDHGKLVATGTPAELKARVGGRSLYARPLDPAQLDQLSTVVTAVIGPVTVADGAIAAPVADERANDRLAQIARQLDHDGLAVAELGLRLASLDDVFLALTGDKVREGAR